jgi:hypothetical protein
VETAANVDVSQWCALACVAAYAKKSVTAPSAI